MKRDLQSNTLGVTEIRVICFTSLKFFIGFFSGSHRGICRLLSFKTKQV